MRFFGNLWRNRKTAREATTIVTEHAAAGNIDQLCVGDGTLAIGFVTGRRLNGGIIESEQEDKILYLIERDGQDWAERQQYGLKDFLGIPPKIKAEIDCWNFWPELALAGDTLVFSRGYQVNPETQPQRDLGSQPATGDDLDEIYILKRQGGRWLPDRTIGNSAPIAGFNSAASRIYKVYALALRGNTLVALIDGENITSGLHIFKRAGSKWSLLQQLPLACPRNWQNVRWNPGSSSIFLDGSTLVVYTGAYDGRHELRIFGRRDRQWSLEKVISAAQPLGALTMGSHLQADRAGDYNHLYSVDFLRLDNNRLAVRVGEHYNFEGITDVYVLRRRGSDWQLEANIAQECDPDDFNSYWQLEARSRQSGRLFGADKIPAGIAQLARSLANSHSVAYTEGGCVAMTAFDENQRRFNLLIFKKDDTDWLMEQEIALTEIADDTPFASKSSSRGKPELEKVALNDETLIIHVTYPRERAAGANEFHHFDEHDVCVFTRQGKKWRFEKRFSL